MENQKPGPDGGRRGHGPQGTTEGEISKLDPDGDVILVVEDEPNGKNRKFLVSSKALGLASPVFFKLFNSGFKESLEIKRGECPEIALKEDDSDAMAIIFAALHHQNEDLPDNLEPRLLAMVAIQSDKYDCNRSLKPWISQWCSSLDEFTNPVGIGFLVLAAHLLRPSNYSEIQEYAAINLPPEFRPAWDNETMNRLPNHAKCCSHSRP